MKRLFGLGTFLILSVELLTLALPDRGLVLTATGVALALALLSVRRVVGRRLLPDDDAGAEDLGESLRRWVANTETTIRWSDSTRADWDRHLRPMLARRYEIATGQRLSKDPAAYHASGRMLFGTELWEWVNPNNVIRGGDLAPGPGRAALETILRKLEQV
ncbi:hypothetical protein [Mycobacterium sp. Lab-001]|uniref:hypothetical protein n=1 Tax=Mycobacterium sp. Lab-001 TaxID=3410136 RepID=UPI003D16B32E